MIGRTPPSQPASPKGSALPPRAGRALGSAATRLQATSESDSPPNDASAYSQVSIIDYSLPIRSWKSAGLVKTTANKTMSAKAATHSGERRVIRAYRGSFSTKAFRGRREQEREKGKKKKKKEGGLSCFRAAVPWEPRTKCSFNQMLTSPPGAQSET